jgi:hypothetical protein
MTHRPSQYLRIRGFGGSQAGQAIVPEVRPVFRAARGSRREELNGVESAIEGGKLRKSGHAERRILMESNSSRKTTITEQKPESYQTFKHSVMGLFNSFYEIQFSSRHPGNQPDLRILNNRHCLVEIRRIEKKADIFGFATLFSLFWLENGIRNLSSPSRIWFSTLPGIFKWITGNIEDRGRSSRRIGC